MSSNKFEEILEAYEQSKSAEGSFSSVDELCQVFWAWRMINWPEYATFCGCHDFDDRLNDTSLEAFEMRETKAKELLETCSKINMSSLSSDDTLNLHLLKEELKLFVDGAPFKGYLLPVNFFEGMQSDFQQLTSWMVFNTAEDYQKYLKRLKALPDRLACDTKLMEEGIKTGLVYNSYSLRGVLEQFDALLQSDVEKSVFYEPLVSMPDSVAQEVDKEEFCQVIKEEVIPAFTKMRIFIENDYIPNCRKEIAVQSVPKGKEFYQQCLRFHLSLDMTPEQVHELGRQEVARIRKEMEEVMKQLDFQGDFREFLNHLRTNSEFYYEDCNDLLDGFRDICYDKIRPKLSALFKKIPTSKLIIKPSPKPVGPVGFYLTGTQDKSRPGVFFVNAHNVKLCPKYEMMTLALHEGEPGHHFQGMYSIESEGAPLFRKHNEDMCYFQTPSRFPMYTAFVEGWGLYSEFLGNEMGLYEDDLYSKFGHLSFEMHRACRLVADTGIHAMGWSYQKAHLLFLENTALSEEFVTSEVNRYITWPGQACAYKVGQLKLKQLRNKAKSALGEDMDVQEFHEVILSCLQCPLNVVEKLVNDFIQKKKAQS